jgi:hypothetical protein
LKVEKKQSHTKEKETGPGLGDDTGATAPVATIIGGGRPAGSDPNATDGAAAVRLAPTVTIDGGGAAAVGAKRNSAGVVVRESAPLMVWLAPTYLRRRYR